MTKYNIIVKGIIERLGKHSPCLTLIIISLLKENIELRKKLKLLRVTE